jgi:hypothetical protein
MNDAAARHRFIVGPCDTPAVEHQFRSQGEQASH